MKSALIFLAFFAGLETAQAYPEMIRHHYVNCTACHFSPAGGGLLNQYGRTISFEVLSTWGGEKEARPFYGAFDNEKLNQWLQVGGDVRGVQVHQENSQTRDGRFIPMQEGIEVATMWKGFTADAFIGQTNMDWVYRAVATRYYLMYQALDELTFRVGRFIPVFGLNIPQHTFNTRANLGFSQGQERDSFETMWSGEKWNIALTVSKNPRIGAAGDVEQGEALQVNYTLADSYRLGASYWYGDSETQRRQILGVHAVLGFTEKFYALTELDYQKRDAITNKSFVGGFNHFAKVGYEIYKGFHLQAVEEQSKGDLQIDSTAFTSYGAGFLFYPRPHMEFEALISKRHLFSGLDENEDYDYLMIHYYF